MNEFRKYHILSIFDLYEKQNLPLDVFLRQYVKLNKSLGSKDRNYIFDVCFNILRFKDLLDYLSDCPYSWEKRYQTYLIYDGNFQNINQSIPLHTKVSFPLFFFNKIKEHYSLKQTLHFCNISNQRAPVTIRTNLLKITRANLLKKLNNPSIYVPCKESSSGIFVTKKTQLISSSEFKEGLFEIQDEGSQLIVSSLIKTKPKDLVLDYCSGSGGKTLAFAHTMNNQGKIYLYDIRSSALINANKRLLRNGVKNAQILFSSSKLSKLIGKMDWVIVDVPCSGSGTLRRNPDIKWNFSSKNFLSYIKTQRNIFSNALKYVKKNGYIVYITCSIFFEENEHQVEYFLKNFHLTLSSSIGWLPKEGGKDGFFGCTFQKQ